MALATIHQISGRAVPVPGDDIDTDRIIPARFMKCVTFDGLGEFLFHDVRKTPSGEATPHPLNDVRYAGANILLTGNNFGCGSSREHAPQAIAKAGFKAIVAEGFAEIFFGNATQLGIPCVSISRTDRTRLQEVIESDPQQVLTIDLIRQRITCGSMTIFFQMREGARRSLIEGTWDPLVELMESQPRVDEMIRALAYV